jgi:hypothetical protein
MEEMSCELCGRKVSLRPVIIDNGCTKEINGMKYELGDLNGKL